jgi:hypothetical protein
VARESDAIPLIRAHVASGTIVHADESNAWERLHASYDVRRVNHSTEYKAEDGANVNQAESYFSRLRRAEIGQHHRISGHLLHQYANEAAWREDNRRKPNGTNWNAVIGAALAGPKSPVWAGYWHRAVACQMGHFTSKGTGMKRSGWDRCSDPRQHGMRRKPRPVSDDTSPAAVPAVHPERV